MMFTRHAGPLDLLKLFACSMLLVTSQSQTTIEELESRLVEIEKKNMAIARQMIRQMFAIESKIRSDGTSGIKQMRQNREGVDAHLSNSHSGATFAAMHDHANNQRTAGLGEFIAVLNGVEFRTRHNDYKFVMPHTTSSELHKTEDIPYPAVPEAVLNKPNVAEQIEEMRAWFKAWKDQDASERDYTKYFKPNICYLEGTWTKATETIAESFVSDRHKLDADTWFGLQETVRFLAYNGGKHLKEDLASLPRVLLNITEEDNLEFAQWNYRILCHPLSFDLPLNRLRVVDELKSRLIDLETIEKYAKSKRARFVLNAKDRDTFVEGYSTRDLLEKIMKEVPGQDNYQGNLQDDAATGISLVPGSNNQPLNAAYYHRMYAFGKKDASGNARSWRSFTDKSVFMAMTSQESVVGMESIKCYQEDGECSQMGQKWTYAVPLEIVYFTPLQTWNPYNLIHKGTPTSDEGKTVDNGGAYDGTADNPFNGTHNRKYFTVPIEFFDGTEVNPDLADTTPTEPVHVLDPTGTVQKVTAGGVRIFTPVIKGVGSLRQRYPIAPVYAEGSATWMELDALKKIIMSPETYTSMFYEQFGQGTGSQGDVSVSTPIQLLTRKSQNSEVAVHTHTIDLSRDEYNELILGKLVTVTTSQDNSHVHDMTLEYQPERNSTCPGKIFYVKCDGKEGLCWDSHGRCTAVKKGVNFDPVQLQTRKSLNSEVAEHTHKIDLSRDEYNLLILGKTVNVTTSQDNNHVHDMTLEYQPEKNSTCPGNIFYVWCDGKEERCWDLHSRCTAVINGVDFV